MNQINSSNDEEYFSGLSEITPNSGTRGPAGTDALPALKGADGKCSFTILDTDLVYAGPQVASTVTLQDIIWDAGTWLQTRGTVWIVQSVNNFVYTLLPAGNNDDIVPAGSVITAISPPFILTGKVISSLLYTLTATDRVVITTSATAFTLATTTTIPEGTIVILKGTTDNITVFDGTQTTTITANTPAWYQQISGNWIKIS